MDHSSMAPSERSTPIEQSARQALTEPRWPVALAIVTVVLLLGALPKRIMLFPGWAPFVIGGAVLFPVVVVAVAPRQARWLQLERMVTRAFCVTMTFVMIANLANLVSAMVGHSGTGGPQLLASSIGLWLTNVLTFSLLYWQIDRGGPECRGTDVEPRPDWMFPQEGAPEGYMAPGWRPIFVDYLFLAFWTATAFSPTDAMPMTPRAKLLMMFESMISLATVVVVASRAINILGN
jgi:hypothetical protein